MYVTSKPVFLARDLSTQSQRDRFGVEIDFDIVS